MNDKFTDVLGVDASFHAIEKARKEYSNIAFKQVNFLDEESVSGLKEEVSDVNIYVRGVLNQIQENNREQFCSSLKKMIGKKGYLYINESLSNQQQQIRENNSKLFNIPLKKNPFLPAGISKAELLNYFPENEYQCLLIRESILGTNLKLDNENNLRLDSLSYVITRG